MRLDLRFIFVLPTIYALSLLDARSAIHHLNTRPRQVSVESLANVRIPRRDGREVLAYSSKPMQKGDALPVLILIHEFFGLTQSICDKADSLAEEVGCMVIAPDTFRGETSSFIPKCIFLALTTPQERVNEDLDDVLDWASNQPGLDTDRLAVMGFCYGGGKAIAYTTACRPNASTVVCYGKPVTEVKKLSNLKKPVCGVFGSLDMQFPLSLIQSFESALEDANVPSEIKVYEGVGHAFWADMDEVRRGVEPQSSAYTHVTNFLRSNF